MAPFLGTGEEMSLLLVSLLLLCLARFLIKPAKGKATQPPSPARLPLIGNLHQLGLLPHRSLRDLSLKHGPLMLIRFGSSPTLVVSDRDSAREILKTHDREFCSRPELIIPHHVFYKGKDVIFAKYGEYWRQAKKICVLHLFSAKRVESFRSVREEEVFLMVEDVLGSSGPVNLSGLLISTTSNIASRVVLGEKYSKAKQKGGKGFRELLEELMVLMGAFHFGDIFPWLKWMGRLTGLDTKLKKNSREWDDFLEQVLEEHLNRRRDVSGDSRHDFVDVLLDIQKSGELGVPFNREHIKALILDMFVAGTDTSYSVMEWAMTELIKHPQVMQKLQEEIRRTVQGRRRVAEDDLHRMGYLKAVIKETLRLHPPAPVLVPREAREDVTVRGYHVAAQTWVMINVWAIGRDPKLWEDPEEFRPERFLHPDAADFRKHDYQFIPFGAGRRGCPGLGFAILTIELSLANLLNSFDWEFVGEGNSEGPDMAEVCGITLRKKSPLLVVARPQCHR